MRVKCPYCEEEYDVATRHFKNGSKCPHCCNKYENSFAYHIQVELGESLNKYWDWEKNTVNPYLISKCSNKKIWIKCNKTDYHESHLTKGNDFVSGNRCPYCSTRHGKVHPMDSFGTLYPEKAKYWDYNKNKISPHKVTSHTYSKYWFICEKCGSSFKKGIEYLNRTDVGVVCKKCNASEGEQIIKNYLDNMNLINGTDYIHDKEYFKDLIGLGGGILRPDFILPNLKVWIEYDGGQHEEFVTWMHGTYKEFEKQQKHDEIKNQYAIKHGWNLIRIKPEDKDNIETILENILKEVI